jgi:hypothetical protein
MTKNNTRKNKQWMRNRNQLKHPKVFNVTMVRNPNGTFHMIGGQSKVLIRKNQHAGEWVNVDTRDLTCEIRNSRITSL